MGRRRCRASGEDLWEPGLGFCSVKWTTGHQAGNGLGRRAPPAPFFVAQCARSSGNTTILGESARGEASPVRLAAWDLIVAKSRESHMSGTQRRRPVEAVA